MSLIGSVSSMAFVGTYSKVRPDRLGKGVEGSSQDVPRTEVAPQTVTAKAPDTSRGFLV